MTANANIEKVVLEGSQVAHDLSVWGLFSQADMVVKLVMIALILASVWCWAIIIDKYFSMKNLNMKAKRFERLFWSGESLEKLYDRTSKKPADPMTRTFNAGMREWKLADEKGLSERMQSHLSLQQRIERSMDVTIGREMDAVEKNMTFLATVGSTAPFVGLFGTVWGIMNSFAAIAGSNDTSLAVVAPGIAEALFATALGLVAAIPAVIGYNKFSADMSRYSDRMESFATEFPSILSRYMDSN